MELMSGSLCDARTYSGLTCPDIFGALQIMHRDIKPDNILVANERDPPFLAKLADLGLAVKCPRGQKLRQRRGTAAFFAPEMYGTNGYDSQADQWAVGLTIFWLLFDRLPWGPPGTPRFPGPGAERYPDLTMQILREPIASSAKRRRARNPNFRPRNLRPLQRYFQLIGRCRCRGRHAWCTNMVESG